MTIDAYNQFITWAEFPATPKPRKVPVNPMTLTPVDPHNPTNWMSRAETEAHCARDNRLRVGFVLTDADPFFFLDLDGCLTPTGWDQESTAVFQMFAGAAAEVSISGNGLHIMGRCDQQLLRDRAHKFGSPMRPKPTWLEFYTRARFVALGYGFTGDFNLDCTAQLLRFVPTKEAVGDVDLEAGPDPRYTGPADDEELIARMLASRVSAGAAFGTKATVKGLWEGDAAILCQAFPSSTGDVYDRSAADAALLAHLAFWTGKDAARMDRLFRRSGLMREKYAERPDYRTNSVRNAIAGCKAFYDKPPVTGQTQAAEQVAQTTDSFLTPPDQQAYFAGCVYVSGAHRVFSLHDGQFYKPEQFNAMKGGKRFMIDWSAPRNETDDAFTAFTKNRAIQFPKAFSTCFRPNASPGAIINGNVNVYVPDPQPTQPGDPMLFLNHIRKLLPNERDQKIILAWMASLIQNQGTKFQWAVVLQGVEGNGKSFLAECLQACIGPRYCHTPGAEDLVNKFNGYLEGKIFINVEEIHMSGRREVLDVLKPLITNPNVEIQNKGADKRMIENVANWFFCTNHKDAIFKTKNDRRYAIFFTAQQYEEDLERDGMNEKYFDALFGWARKGGGFAIINNFLQNYKIDAELDPAKDCHRAPITSTTPEAINASKGRAEQLLDEAVASETRGFRNGWISIYCAEIILKEGGVKSMGRTAMKGMLENMGYRHIGRATQGIREEDLKRPELYAHKSIITRELTTIDYLTAQGYSDAPAPAAIPMFGRGG